MRLQILASIEEVLCFPAHAVKVQLAALLFPGELLALLLLGLPALPGLCRLLKFPLCSLAPLFFLLAALLLILLTALFGRLLQLLVVRLHAGIVFAETATLLLALLASFLDASVFSVDGLLESGL